MSVANRLSLHRSRNASLLFAALALLHLAMLLTADVRRFSTRATDGERDDGNGGNGCIRNGSAADEFSYAVQLCGMVGSAYAVSEPVRIKEANQSWR